MPRENRELEVLAPLDDGGSDPGDATSPPRLAASWRALLRRVRWRWLAAVLAVAVVAVGLAVPGRSWLARRELAWLQRQWRQSTAEDQGRDMDAQRLDAYIVVGEGDQAVAAKASLYRQERTDLVALAGRLRHAVLVDPGLSKLRGEMAASLDHRSSLLDQANGAGRATTPGASESFIDDGAGMGLLAVSTTLTEELARWHVRPLPNPAPADFASVGDALRKLSVWVDQPTGTVLLAPNLSGNELARLDVDHSRVTSTTVTDSGWLTPRSGYLAYIARNVVYAVAPDGSGTPRSLARNAAYLMPAADPAALWVVSDGTATEIDATGQVLAGPLRPPGVPEAATTGGLVISLSSPGSIGQWNPATGRVNCRLEEPGLDALTLAASGDVVAWMGGLSTLHVANFATCKELLQPPAPLDDPGLDSPIASFSPNGRMLALSVPAGTAGGGTSHPLELIDTTSGQSREVPFPAAPTGDHAIVPRFVGIDPIAGVTWSADGQRLFWLYPGSPSTSAQLWTWRLGDPVAQPVHATGLAIAGPLYPG